MKEKLGTDSKVIDRHEKKLKKVRSGRNRVLTVKDDEKKISDALGTVNGN